MILTFNAASCIWSESWLFTVSFFQICTPCPPPSLKPHHTDDENSAGMVLAHVTVSEHNTGVLPCTPLNKQPQPPSDAGLCCLIYKAGSYGFFLSFSFFLHFSFRKWSFLQLEFLVIPVEPVNLLWEERVWWGCQGTSDLQHQTFFLHLPTCRERPYNTKYLQLEFSYFLASTVFLLHWGKSKENTKSTMQ